MMSILPEDVKKEAEKLGRLLAQEQIRRVKQKEIANIVFASYLNELMKASKGGRDI